jgi:cardiolipin synthase A/B
MTAMAEPGLGAESDDVRRLRRATEGLVGVPASEGNAVTVLRNGDQIFPAMLEAIEGAEHTIDFLTYVYWAGRIGRRFAEALAARARAGVRVRILLDDIGARPMRKELLGVLVEGGCQVRWFRPVRRVRPGIVNHRTHRKLLVCDEHVSFTGGVGIADEWCGDARDETEWRDTHCRIEGPATDGLRAAFIDNWAETDKVLFEPGTDRFPDQPQPGTATIQVVRGASEPGWNDISTLLRAVLALAERRLRITTAYFVPDDHLKQLLCDAADRGVEVEVLLPGPHADKRFVQIAGEGIYQSLLDCGVKLWNFQPSMLHAKTVTVDGIAAIVGSANFNNRSTTLDEEVCCLVFDDAVVRELARHFDEDLARATRIEPGRWARRSVPQRVKERVVRVAEPFL